MRKGFTLIELLIVVAIIAVLAAIAIPNYLHAQIRAQIARSLADMKNLGMAIEAFRVDYNMLLLDDFDDGTQSEVDKYATVLPLTVVGLSTSFRPQNIVMNPLTTPQSYISALPPDPFMLYKTAAEAQNAGMSASAIGMINLLAPTYFYADNKGLTPEGDHRIGGFMVANAWRYNLRPLQKDEWVLLGFGPDFKPEDAANYTHRGVPYDPSNGLRSRGDLFCRAGGEVSN